jgi:hypothetical protein
MKEITVRKRNGEVETFDHEKLRTSLKNAFAPDELIEEIVQKIEAEAGEETTTDVIYNRAFQLLKEKRRSYAARYSLRQSLADLGPTGYPFESFVGRIFQAKGFEVTVGVTIDGDCISHEVDVVAENENKLLLTEAKFHNSRSIKSAVQTSLYVKARFDDIADNDFGTFAHKDKEIERWLITNTKFSDQAIAYGECIGMKMIGWGYPEDENLQSLIMDTGLQPVTALTTLSGSNKRELTEQGVVLCKTLRNERDKLAALGFSKEKIADVLDEVNHLCHT